MSDTAQPVPLHPLIQRWVSAGFNLIPVNNEKRPAVQWKDYQFRKATQAELAGWFGGSNPKPAVICGSISGGLTCIDCDDPKITALISIYTLTIKTPSGGYHIYVISKKIPEKKQAYRGFSLDIIGEKAYAVLPPAKVNGGEYTIVKDAPIAEFDDILEYIDSKLPDLTKTEDTPKDLQKFKQKAGTDIIKRWVQEETKGHNYWQGKCPFHNDTTPSFTVYDNGYYCFSCGAHGDIIEFVMNAEAIDFKAAVKKISDISGIKAPDLKKQDNTKTTKKQKDEEKLLYGDIARQILEKYPIITLRDNPAEMYYYENGVYKYGAEAVIRELAQRIMGDEKSSKHGVNEVIFYIQNVTFIDRSKINVEKHLINLKNGYYNIKTKVLEPHTPEIYSISQIPVIYDPAAVCPNIVNFLCEILKPKDIALMLQLFGYCLIPDYSIHKAFLWYGDGWNGKGTLGRLFVAFIGEENKSSESLQALNTDKFSSVKLYGKLVNIDTDLADASILDDTLFKKLTGQDWVSGQRKYQTGFDFRNTARLIFGANDIPRHPKGGFAWNRRWILIEFPCKFEGADNDPDLDSKLQTEEELSGLLNLAIMGLHWLLDRKMFFYDKTPEQVGEEYLLKSDSVVPFMNECTEPDDGFTNTQDLYRAYRIWAKFKQLKKIEPMNIFGRSLRRAGYTSTRPFVNGKQIYAYEGVAIDYDKIAKLENPTNGSEKNQVIETQTDTVNPTNKLNDQNQYAYKHWFQKNTNFSWVSWVTLALLHKNWNTYSTGNNVYNIEFWANCPTIPTNATACRNQDVQKTSKTNNRMPEKPISRDAETRPTNPTNQEKKEDKNNMHQPETIKEQTKSALNSALKTVKANSYTATTITPSQIDKIKLARDRILFWRGRPLNKNAITEEARNLIGDIHRIYKVDIEYEEAELLIKTAIRNLDRN